MSAKSACFSRLARSVLPRIFLSDFHRPPDHRFEFGPTRVKFVHVPLSCLHALVHLRHSGCIGSRQVEFALPSGQEFFRSKNFSFHTVPFPLVKVRQLSLKALRSPRRRACFLGRGFLRNRLPPPCFPLGIVG